MSLDVYLERKRPELPEAGKAVELLRANGFDLYADEISARHDCGQSECLYDANITHNLNKMADAAGVYKELWRPDEIGVTQAKQLIEPLRAGLGLLRSDRHRFEQFNPSNGWGDYDGLVSFVAGYLAACEENPDANVRVSR
jgi:hypothetical protein